MLYLLVLTLLLSPGLALRIGSYNIYLLDSARVTDQTTLDIFVKVFSRNDVTAFQGVKEPAAIATIVTELKKSNSNWAYDISGPLQRNSTTTPEHLGFIYRSDKVGLTTTNKINDDGDLFERDLYSALVFSVTTVVPAFVLTSVHLYHLDAVNETAQLPGAFNQISASFGNQNILMAGDFNAGEPFLTKAQYDAATVTTDSDYDWIIEYDDDTVTYTNTTSAWARFLVSGSQLQAAAKLGSRGVINLISEYNLTETQALACSPLFPVEMRLIENAAVVG